MTKMCKPIIYVQTLTESVYALFLTVLAENVIRGGNFDKLLYCTKMIILLCILCHQFNLQMVSTAVRLKLLMYQRHQPS
jgi:hypothetical protein